MKLGFIGCGNMAMAIIGGIVSSKKIAAEDIIVSNPTNEKLLKIQNDFKVNITNDNLKVIDVDYLFLCVKPNIVDEVLREIKPMLNEKVVVISIAAGIKISQIENSLKGNFKVIRLMPNTPALVNASMTSLTVNVNVSEVEKKAVWDLLTSIGKVVEVSEDLIDAIIAIAGSAPAYIYMMIESMADAGVSYGLKRDVAYMLAAQTVMGSGKMVLETKMHPASLKDMVTSPKGTTIEAVKKLEETGFRSAIIQAMDACYNKSKSL